MPKYEIIEECLGFEIGQIVEFSSPSRIAEMNGDEINPPKGKLYIEKVKKERNSGILKVNSHKGERNENSIGNRMDGFSGRKYSKSDGRNGKPINAKRNSKTIREKDGKKTIGRK